MEKSNYILCFYIWIGTTVSRILRFIKSCGQLKYHGGLDWNYRLLQKLKFKFLSPLGLVAGLGENLYPPWDQAPGWEKNSCSVCNPLVGTTRTNAACLNSDLLLRTISAVLCCIRTASFIWRLIGALKFPVILTLNSAAMPACWSWQCLAIAFVMFIFRISDLWFKVLEYPVFPVSPK